MYQKANWAWEAVQNRQLQSKAQSPLDRQIQQVDCRLKFDCLRSLLMAGAIFPKIAPVFAPCSSYTAASSKFCTNLCTGHSGNFEVLWSCPVNVSAQFVYEVLLEVRRPHSQFGGVHVEGLWGMFPTCFQSPTQPTGRNLQLACWWIPVQKVVVEAFALKMNMNPLVGHRPWLDFNQVDKLGSMMHRQTLDMKRICEQLWSRFECKERIPRS